MDRANLTFTIANKPLYSLLALVEVKLITYNIGVETMMKINLFNDRKDKRDKNCIIWSMFIDAIDQQFYIDEYCKKNCRYRCLKNEPHKTIN